jgi:hypothetical protein
MIFRQISIFKLAQVGGKITRVRQSCWETREEDSRHDPSTQMHCIEACSQALTKHPGVFDQALPKTPTSKSETLRWPLKKSHTNSFWWRWSGLPSFFWSIQSHSTSDHLSPSNMTSPLMIHIFSYLHTTHYETHNSLEASYLYFCSNYSIYLAVFTPGQLIYLPHVFF